MEIECTFALVENSLYTVKFASETTPEFRRLFALWNDPEFLFEFFTKNESVLKTNWKGISVEDAILKTRNEANKFRKELMDTAKIGLNGGSINLSGMFHQLQKDESITRFRMQKKAYGGNNSWLRIYAIKLRENSYIITGGGIKLKKTMSESGLDDELVKINVAQKYIAKGEDENLEQYELFELIPE